MPRLMAQQLDSICSVFTAWATATNRSSINVRVFSGANNATSGVVAVDLEVGAFSSLGGV